jgi:predicted homoserine dehydrogenase-like protein
MRGFLQSGLQNGATRSLSANKRNLEPEESPVNLARLLKRRAAENRPIRVGVIGAGKFSSMFLAQVRTTPGMQVAKDVSDALKNGRTAITEDANALIDSDVEVVIDITGSPAAAIRHCLRAFERKKHVVNVTVEADVLAGPLLAARAQQAGVIYALAYGDQPSLVCEMVDWAEACGFRVVSAGKGTKYLPEYVRSTPATVWDHYGLTAEQAASAGMNSQMFNSFLDGTKSAIEMAAISNATGLRAPRNGLLFPPCGAEELPQVLIPKAHGGVLEDTGMVEVVSSLQRDGSNVARDLRWGVYVVFEAGADDAHAAYTRNCFREYGMATDKSGRYCALYRPYHMIGLELGISVANAVLRNEATGTPDSFRSDVAAVAKKALAPGEVLDGEGGFTVWGKILRAEDSLTHGALPIGLAHKVKVTKPVAEGAVVRWDDVAVPDDDIVRFRKEMEKTFAPKKTAAA